MKLDMSKQNGNADYFGFVQVCLRLAEIKQVIWWQDDVLPSCSALCVLQTFFGAQNCVYKIIIISQSTFLCLKVLLSAVTGGQSTQERVMRSFLIPSCALLSSSSCCLVARVVSSYVTHLILWICEFNSCHCQQCWCGFFFFCFFFFFWQAGITHQSHGSFVWKMLVLEKVDLSAQHCMVLACSTTKDKCSFQ